MAPHFNSPSLLLLLLLILTLTLLSQVSASPDENCPIPSNPLKSTLTRNLPTSPRALRRKSRRTNGNDDDNKDKDNDKDKDKDKPSQSAFNNTLAGRTLRATFTWYGTNDARGSPNCNSNRAACGFYTFPGFSAAVSQNLFGTEEGKGGGPGCGTCWRLEPQTDKDGKDIRGKVAQGGIVVLVNNLCPATSANPLCSQSTLDAASANQFGGVIDVNVCNDSGAKAALFGDSGVEMAVGNATQVDCGAWQGTKKFDAGSKDDKGSNATPSINSGEIGASATPINVGSGVIGAAHRHVVGYVGYGVPLVVGLAVWMGS